jgi:negative regulator of sigma E activity
LFYLRVALSLEELGWLQRDEPGHKVWERREKLRDMMRGVSFKPLPFVE